MKNLATERLKLGHPVLPDADGMAAFYSDPEVRRYLSDGTLAHQQTREEVEVFEREDEDEYGPFHLYSMRRLATAAASSEVR